MLLVGVVSAVAYASATVQSLPPGFFLDAIADPLVIWAYMPFAFLFDRPELFAKLAFLLVPATVVVIGTAQILTLWMHERRALAWLTWKCADRAALCILRSRCVRR